MAAAVALGDQISCGGEGAYRRIVLDGGASDGAGAGSGTDAAGGLDSAAGGSGGLLGGSGGFALGGSALGGAGGLGGETSQTGGVGVGGGATIGPGGAAAGGTIAPGGGMGGGGGTPGAGSGGAAGASAFGGAAGGSGPGGNGGGGTGPSRIISIDFVGSAPTAMAAGEVAGFKPAANWNSATGASGTLASVVDSNGVVVPGVQVSWSASGVFALWTADVPGNPRMYNGYLDPMTLGVPATITISGLPGFAATANFDVYLYAMGNITASGEERDSVYSMGPVMDALAQRGPSATTPQGLPPFGKATNGGLGNYVEFTKVSLTSFTILATPGTPPNGGQARAPVNGIQIVMPFGS
jgi:hypothetical protein